MAFNFTNGTWTSTNISELDMIAINNFAEWGQPVSPYQNGFNHEIYNNWDGNVTIRYPQLEVMNNGYGVSVGGGSFSAIQNWTSGQIAVQNGVYSFNDLVDLGVFQNSDRKLPGNLYSGELDSGSISTTDAAYVHGTVQFALMANTTFYSANGNYWVVSEVGAFDDNFDFQSSNTFAQFLNPFIQGNRIWDLT